MLWCPPAPPSNPPSQPPKLPITEISRFRHPHPTTTDYYTGEGGAKGLTTLKKQAGGPTIFIIQITRIKISIRYQTKDEDRPTKTSCYAHGKSPYYPLPRNRRNHYLFDRTPLCPCPSVGSREGRKDFWWFFCLFIPTIFSYLGQSGFSTAWPTKPSVRSLRPLTTLPILTSTRSRPNPE